MKINIQVLCIFFLYYIFKIPCVCYTCGIWISRTSLVVQWLRLHVSNAGDMGLIPGWKTKMLYAVWHGEIKQNFTQFGSAHISSAH